MKSLLLSFCTLLAVSLSYAADPAQPNIDPKMQENMKKFKEYSTPGPGHKVLESMVG